MFKALLEGLIGTVRNYPELYDVTLPVYRDRDKRADAWERVGAEIGRSADECKTKWKSIRDRYARDRRLERTKKKKAGFWDLRDSLSFLDPYIKERQGSQLDEWETAEDLSNRDDCGSDEGIKEPINTNVKASPSSTGAGPLLSSAPPLAPVQQVPPMPQFATERKMPLGLKVIQVSPAPSLVQIHAEQSRIPCATCPDVPRKLKREAREMEQTVEQQDVRDRPQDEDELFLLSFVPALKRLPPQKRGATKIKIQQILYDAEFSD
ncbi:uncharacterized protein LOC114787122 [Denticeps clupeoides]|uniref:Transcription factor Adf-1-like n=1 Tax=Denticeps clupeoides TaxID=299321 RepID=A0AAY4BCM9_9TELE|nr:uncharacterized protein LOC114787122 [Denticeps clupeoides]